MPWFTTAALDRANEPPAPRRKRMQPNQSNARACMHGGPLCCSYDTARRTAVEARVDADRAAEPGPYGLFGGQPLCAARGIVTCFGGTPQNMHRFTHLAQFAARPALRDCALQDAP
ncbi:hypothetical protein BRPE64_ACDS08720 [Caballeronia insecticola]|uniref:Uncharacterized protein n=1 Tax=Caballeronia insecticola TaxID=758793 RepID=R4WUM5_9BURK|nr:hypothetical protein BRPE64_ACDS08720 [Caballeronia insecticola]